MATPTPQARLAARIREADAAIRARQPLHADGPVYPVPGGHPPGEFAHAILRYDAYAIGVLTTLATEAAYFLERSA